MRIKHIIYSFMAAGALLAPAGPAQAKTVDILGITNDGLHAQLKGRLNLPQGKTISSVTTYSYNMTDGYAITNTAYDVVTDTDGTQFITADVNYYPDADGHTYRIELTYNDGSKYQSEVVNEDLTESFMWLGDYKWAEAVSGWDAQHPPVVDRSVDPSATLYLDGVHYYKAVSNHANGYLLYTWDNPGFSRFVTRYGIQDNEINGDVLFKFYTGTDKNVTSEGLLTPRVSQTMYSLSNASRKDAPCVADLDIDMTGVAVLRVQLDQIDNNWGDHSHLAMARLYLPSESQSAKKSQSVTFTTPEGHLEDAVELDAVSSSGGKIFYRIISGRNLAQINGNVLTPLWGAKGTVVVEATQYGNDEFFPATDYQTFTVDMQPSLQILGMYRPTVPDVNYKAYFHTWVDTKGRALDELKVTVYDNVNTLVKKNEINLIGKYSSAVPSQVIEFEIDGFADQVLELSYSYADDPEIHKLPYWHTDGSFDYISDMPTSSVKMTVGWGSPSAPNKSFNGDNGGILNIVANPNVNYAKGYGLHARGVLEMQPGVLAPYDRVAVDMGAQKGYGGNLNQTMAYRIECGSQIVKTTQTFNPETNQYEGGDVPKSEYVSWNEPINNGAILRLIIESGSDNSNDNDHVCLGAPRLYYTPAVKSPQTIQWVSEKYIVNNRQTSVALDAVPSTGMPVYYYIVKGKEFARIEGDNLVISDIPNGDNEIIVDAYQPGSDEWSASNVATCSFRLSRGLEVQRHEYVEISGPDDLDRLIIHADKESAGQVSVKDGLINVRQVVLKYTFNPGEWNYLSFPANVNLDKISDLNALGYTYNAYGAPAYYLREFSTAGHENDPFGDSDWEIPEEPQVIGGKGYTIAIDDRLTTDPVEVTFTIDNTSLDLKSVMNSLGLTLDLSSLRPGTVQTLTISSANPDIVSNNLTIDVLYEPADLSSLPLNHREALEKMRFVFVGEHKAIRLTLPDQTPARVAFFDNSGKKVIKAVRYIAPYVIDLSDMKPGKYNMVVSYGNAVKTYPITL